MTSCAALDRAALALALALVGSGFASHGARADDLQMLRNIGDGYKSVKVITRYEIHPEIRSFDLYAAEPAIPTGSRAIEARIAGETAHAICAGGRANPGWTVRIFLPGDPTPAASCRAGGHAGHARLHRHGSGGASASAAR